jgi:molybdate transport system substrate-binding protein
MTFLSTARLALLLAPLLALPAAAAARAETISVAVAANFVGAAKAIGAAFKADTGDDIAISAGATGGLFAQITEGAPFEVFLAADGATPQKAVDAGFGVKGTRFTYAVGRLVLFSADPKLVTGAETLKSASFQKLAIANPKTAPYGAAAVEAMQRLGVYDALAPKLVTGESIAQAYQFVDSGNAELGFVALSQVIGRKGGSQWLVPQADFAPITQDAVLLAPGKDSKAAQAFLSFLKGPDAATIIKSFGYGTGAR